MTNIPNMSNLPGSSPESQVKMPALFLMIVGAIGAVGVIFGMLPAVRAAKMDPVVALRYE